MTRETELLATWLDNVEEADLREELEAMRDDEKAAIEAFHKDLEFGTAGLRGIIGAGTDRMNVYTVGRATQGFADYLVANYENPSVVNESVASSFASTSTSMSRAKSAGTLSAIFIA